MNGFINQNDHGIEVGSGAGFTKDYIENKNLKLTDLNEDPHLDYKNIDAQSTGFENESFDYVIASNMIHHIPFPIKFFKEMNDLNQNLNLRELSMGMSSDYIDAAKNSATFLRIGSKIFGKRS